MQHKIFGLKSVSFLEDGKCDERWKLLTFFKGQSKKHTLELRRTQKEGKESEWDIERGIMFNINIGFLPNPNKALFAIT